MSDWDLIEERLDEIDSVADIIGRIGEGLREISQALVELREYIPKYITEKEYQRLSEKYEAFVREFNKFVRI